MIKITKSRINATDVISNNGPVDLELTGLPIYIISLFHYMKLNIQIFLSLYYIPARFVTKHSQLSERFILMDHFNSSESGGAAGAF